MIDIAEKRRHTIDEHIHIKELGEIDKIPISGSLAIVNSSDDRIFNSSGERDDLDYLCHPCPVCDRNLQTAGSIKNIVAKKYKSSYNAYEYCEFKCPCCGSTLRTDPFIAKGDMWLERITKSPDDCWFFDKAEEMDKYITPACEEFNLDTKTWPIFIVPIFAIICIFIWCIAKKSAEEPINVFATTLSMLVCGAISLVYYFVRVTTNNRIYRFPKDDK